MENEICFIKFSSEKVAPPNKETPPLENEFLIQSQIYLCPVKCSTGHRMLVLFLHLSMLWLRLFDCLITNIFFMEFHVLLIVWLCFHNQIISGGQDKDKKVIWHVKNIFYVTYTLVKDNFWWSKKNKGLVWRSYRKWLHMWHGISRPEGPSGVSSSYDVKQLLDGISFFSSC